MDGCHFFRCTSHEFAFKLGILKYIFITEKAVLDMFLVAFICMYVCLSEMWQLLKTLTYKIFGMQVIQVKLIGQG